MNWQEIIALVLTILVIALAIFVFTGLYRQVLGPEFFGIDLSGEEKQEYTNNLNIFAENIQNCMAIQDSDCVCEGFPDFPGSFKGKLYLISQGRELKMELRVNENPFYLTEVPDAYITGVLIEKQELTKQ